MIDNIDYQQFKEKFDNKEFKDLTLGQAFCHHFSEVTVDEKSKPKFNRLLASYSKYEMKKIISTMIKE